MLELSGTGVSGGIAIGGLYLLSNEKKPVARKHVDDAAQEISRYTDAKSKAVEQLSELYDKALTQVGEQGALLFEVHQMMLEDEDYCESISNIITQQKVNAEYAVAVTADNFAKMFSEMDDPYMQGRAADVKDISGRLISILSGEHHGGVEIDRPVIIAADDLSPSQTVQLDKEKILAFITKGGSSSSHTAILARTMGIPAVIGLGDAMPDDIDGKRAAVDGSTGQVFIEPDEETIAIIEKKQSKAKERLELLSKFKGKQAVTKEGKHILTYANIGNPSDLGLVLANDAEGIGLFRSEFLYLENDDYPTEEQQFAAYKTVAETMGGKRVIFRTLDIGADKQADYFELDKEENPAMGLRAIRICLTRPQIFKTQLRALYRASAFGKAAIMFPMIISLDEIKQIKEIVEEVKSELRKENIRFDEELEIGVMIETPAAALISGELAKEVDFFSIGTNDLSQYTLALDRQTESLNRFFDPHHPAVMELIRMTVANAHANGIWAGICGELGADLTLTEEFVKIGVDELSVAPPAVLPLREKICSI